MEWYCTTPSTCTPVPDNVRAVPLVEQAILYLVIVMLQHVIEALAETGGLKFENMCSNGNDELCFEVHNSYTLFDCYFHVHVLEIYQLDS